MKLAVARLAPLILAAGVLGAAAQDPVVAWIRSQAVPLKTVAAGNGFADMEPLKKMIGDARIVALGEATHGTREFFQLKHRMLEFLATEMGFTIFSIEANMPEAYRINDYVLTGAGDPADLLRGMYFWTWDTEEVLEMIRWMRRYNEAGKGKLEFTGFDMQTPTVAMRIVQDFVAAREPGYAATIAEAAELTRRASVGGGPDVRRRDRVVSAVCRCRQAGALQRIHPDRRDHPRLRRTVVASRRQGRDARVRQHGESRRHRIDRLDQARHRAHGSGRSASTSTSAPF